MNQEIKIVLADDHSMFRQGISMLLKEYSDVIIIGEASHGEELLKLLNSRKADIILLDIHMPVMNGSQTIDILRVRFPDIKIIVVSMDFSPFLLEEYIKKGVHGFIPKGCDIEILMEAINDVRKHGECFALSRSIIKRKTMPFKNHFNLTEKEMMVLSLTCKGNSNKEIGSVLLIAERTVEFHKTNIYSKTEMKSLAEIISYGIKNGLDNL